MNADLDALRLWIRVVLIIAAICTTSVPIIFAFYPWRARPFGKLFMVQAISFAVAMDLSVVFSFWSPLNYFALFWVRAIMLTAIAGSTAAITIAMLLWIRPPKRKVGVHRVTERPRIQSREVRGPSPPAGDGDPIFHPRPDLGSPRSGEGSGNNQRP